MGRPLPRKFFVPLVALAMALPCHLACGRSQPELPLIPTDGVIVAFGDSVTHGVGARAGERYPDVLETLTGRRIVNAGVPGEVTSQGLARLPGVLDEHRPDLLILCEGGNDLLRELEAAQIEQNLREMVRLARNRGIPVLLVGVPEPALLLSSAGLYEEVADDLDLAYEGEALADILSKGSLKSDLIHPNAEGYRRLAEAIHAVLQSTGAV
jgi:lysophospholipase L1-like esterase